jgi:signal transduction histidine kinase
MKSKIKLFAIFYALAATIAYAAFLGYKSVINPIQTLTIIFLATVAMVLIYHIHKRNKAFELLLQHRDAARNIRESKEPLSDAEYLAVRQRLAKELLDTTGQSLEEYIASMEDEKIMNLYGDSGVETEIPKIGEYVHRDGALIQPN